MNALLFDLLLAAIVVISSLLGRKKGFILTLCGFLAIFVAFLGAAALTNLLAPPLSSLAAPFVENHLSALLNSFYADAEGALHATLDQILMLMNSSDVLRGLTGSVAQAVKNGALDISGDAVSGIVNYVALQFTRLILFPIFFLLISLAWKILSYMLDLAFHLPGLNFLNRASGLILGFGRGLLLCFILCWLLKGSYITPEIMDSSFLLPYFCGENPLSQFPILNS